MILVAFLTFVISGVKHIQELVEVSVIDDFNQIYVSKLSLMTNEITEIIFMRALKDCAKSCESLFNT